MFIFLNTCRCSKQVILVWHILVFRRIIKVEDCHFLVFISALSSGIFGSISKGQKDYWRSKDTVIASDIHLNRYKILSEF